MSSVLRLHQSLPVPSPPAGPKAATNPGSGDLPCLSVTYSCPQRRALTKRVKVSADVGEAPASEPKPPSSRKTYLSGGICGGGVDVRTSEAVGLKHHCGNKGSVSGPARALPPTSRCTGRYRLSTFPRKMPALSLWLVNTNLPAHLLEDAVIVLPGATALFNSDFLPKKAVTDNSNYQRVCKGTGLLHCLPFGPCHFASGWLMHAPSHF